MTKTRSSPRLTRRSHRCTWELAGLLKPPWGHLGAILGHLGAILGPSRAFAAPSWDHLRALKPQPAEEAQIGLGTPPTKTSKSREKFDDSGRTWGLNLGLFLGLLVGSPGRGVRAAKHNKLVSCVDVAQKSTSKFCRNGGKWWQMVASARRGGGMGRSARLRQKLSEFNRF